MRTPGPVRFHQALSIGAAALALAACSGGGGTSIGGVSGSSSGGSSSVLAGTFTGQTGASQRTTGSATDTVFGAIDGQGRGFLADMSAASAGNQAVLRISPASQPNAGTVSGAYDAYFTGGSNNSVILGGNLTGTYTASGASLTLVPPGGGTNNTATLVLDKPDLAQASLPTGTYTAQVGTVSGSGSPGSLAISTSNNQADIYTVTVSSGGSIGINDSSGCAYNITSVTPVSGLDVYDLQANGTCPSSTGGTVTPVTLSGLAVYLPTGAKSPLGSGTLAQPALLLELDDSEINNGAKNAFALLAVQ